MEPKRPSFPIGFLIAGILVLIVALAAIFLSSGSKIELTPVVNAVQVSGDFTATPSAGDLPFEVVAFTQVGAKEVKAEGTEDANDAAQGSITIYNTQEKTQELIKNTRFETPGGLIFRIHESLTIPAGSESAPGQQTATIYADVGGEKYNIGPSTFTLPGLKGSALYELVYAKSETSMVGGFTGQRPSVGKATRDAQIPSIEEALKGDLTASVVKKIPEGYAIVPGAIFYSFSPMPESAGSSADTVKVQVQGTATAFVFPIDALGKAIAYRTIGSYAGQKVMLASTEHLTFATTDGLVPAKETDSLAFTLSGKADVVWVIEAEKIAGALAGKTRDAARTLLAGFPEIEKASLVLKPFWDTTLPEDPSQIKVVIQEPRR
ncbi:MAG: hypothetical protein WBK28_01415 [Minisyncoccia bacterium]